MAVILTELEITEDDDKQKIDNKLTLLCDENIGDSSANIEITDWDAYLKSEKLNFNFRTSEKDMKPLKLKDFRILKFLSKGRFGIVTIGYLFPFKKFYAIKILLKKRLRVGTIERTLAQKKILGGIRFPFATHMEYSYQNDTHIYLFMTLAIGLNLKRFHTTIKKFNENVTKFYAAQIVLAIEYLHSLNISCRAIQPLNFIVENNGYLKLIEFGSAKAMSKKTFTICGGDANYLAPEILKPKGYDKSIDWWALGITIYELCAGQPPYYAPNILVVYSNIINNNYKMPKHFSKDLKDIVTKFLQTSEIRRLGNLRHGADDVKNHPWYSDINWLSLLNRKIIPPLKWPHHTYVDLQTEYQFESSFVNF